MDEDFINSFGDSDYEADSFASNNASSATIQQAAQLTAAPSDGWFKTVVGDAALGAVDLLDTAASSIPGVAKITGSKRGQINTAVLSSALGTPGLIKFYNNNREGIELTSGIAGIIASELIGRKLQIAAAPVVALLKTVPYARRIATLDAEYNTAMQTVRAVDQGLASRGVMGAELWKTAIGGRTGVVTAAGPSVGTLFAPITRTAAARKATGLAFAKGLGESARTEAVMGTLLNQNSTLYSEDVGQNLMWMGLGLGIGGGIETLGAKYQMKKFVNSDAIRRLQAGALDPTGFESARLTADLGPEQAKQTYLGSLQGGFTDQVTSLMVEAAARAPAGADLTAYDRLTTQKQTLAVETMQKVTNKGLASQQGTQFAMQAAGFGNHVQLAMKRDAGAMLGVEMIGAVPEEFTVAGLHATKEKQVADRIFDIGNRLDAHAAGTKRLTRKQLAALNVERKQLRFQEQLTPMVLMDGEAVPLSHGAAYDSWVEPNIKAVKSDAETNLWEAHAADGKSHKVGIDSKGEIFLPAGKTLASADHFDVLRLYRSSQHMLNDLSRKVGTPEGRMVLPAKPSWFHLDMAEELLNRTNGGAEIVWPAGLSRESAQKESFVQKVKELGKLGDDVLEGDETVVSKLRVRYNLPRLTAYEMGVLGTAENPIDILVRGAMQQPSELANLSLNDLKRGFAEAKNISDLTNMNAADVKSLTGNSFRFMLDDAGNPVKPVLMYKRPFRVEDWTKHSLAERIATKKAVQAQMLSGNQSGPLTRKMTGDILSNPDFQLAGQTSGLVDTQIASNIPGFGGVAPQTATGSALASLVSAEWRARDNPVLLAMTRLRESVDRQMRGMMRQTMDAAGIGQANTVLNGPTNAASKALLDQFHSFRPGWDLEPDLVKQVLPSGETHHSFILADTVGNRKRFQQQYGRELTQGQVMLSPQGKEIVLDTMGLDMQTKLNAVTETLRIEKNSLLRAQGLPEIHKLDWYVPPPNVQGKFIGFTRDVNGETLPGGTIIANTQEQFAREVAALNDDPKSILNTTPGARFASRDEIKEFANIWDKAQMEMLNPGTTAIQGAKSNRGLLTGNSLNVNQFDESLKHARDSFLTHGDDLIQTLMDDQIKGAMMRSNIASGITRNADSTGIQYRSVYDYWLQEAKGQSPLASSGSAVGWLYNGAERRVNDFLRERAPGIAGVKNTAGNAWAAVNDWVGKRLPWDSTAEGRQTFEKLAAKLGEHMPFESAAQMVARREAGAMPVELADLTGGANRFTATWMLRIAESAQPIMNMAGILNAAPAVIRNVSFRKGETVEEYAARIGHSSTIFTAPDGRSFGALDMGKIAYKGFKRAWSRTSDSEFEYMAQQGFLSQEVAEFQRQFNTIESRGTWGRFFKGDPYSTRSGVAGKFDEKGLVGWISVLSDKSEDFSRSWAHMIGLEVADMIGIEAKVGKHNFAHDVANKMIANYSPHNRAEVFQGAIGSVAGLFQSFMINYYQRMFRYVETKDARSFAIQYATQGTLFGTKSLPGINELGGMFFDHSDGESDPYGAMYHKFGPHAGDLLSYGTLSNLPKLFGLDGVDFTSRGDVQPRIINQNPFTNSPAVSAIVKVKEGIAAGVAQIMDEHGLSGAQASEILSNMLPNRPLAGIVETTLAGGKDTDRNGNLVSDSKSWADKTYRMIGMRGLDQAKELEAFYSNKQAQELEAGKMDLLRTHTRAAIRSGNEDALPGIFNQYVENGGNPRNFKRWLGQTAESATKTRGIRRLEEVMRDPAKMAETQRLMEQGITLEADEATPDPEATLTLDDPMNAPVEPTAVEEDDHLSYGL